MNNKQTTWGILLILISAIGYGLMPIASKLAYNVGTPVSTLLFSRFFIAGCFLWAYIFIKKIPYQVSGKHLMYLIGIGFFGFTLASIAIFKAYELMSGSVATLILFAHPIFVVIIETTFLKMKLTRGKIFAMSLTALGLCLVVLTDDLKITLLGVILSFVSSICYGFFCIGLTEKRTKQLGGVVVTAYVILASGSFNMIQCISSGEPLFPTTGQGWLSVSILAVFSTIIASVCFYEGVQRIGAGNGTLISTTEPVITIILSFMFLHEPLTVNVIAGAVLIITSILLLSRNASVVPVVENEAETATHT